MDVGACREGCVCGWKKGYTGHVTSHAPTPFPPHTHKTTIQQAEIEAAKEVQRMATASLLIDTFTEHVDLAKLLQVTFFGSLVFGCCLFACKKAGSGWVCGHCGACPLPLPSRT